MFENNIGGICETMAEMTNDSDSDTDVYSINDQSRAISSVMDDLVEKGYSPASADLLFEMLQRMRHFCARTCSSGDAKYTDWCEYRRILHTAIKLCSWPDLKFEMAGNRLDFESNLATADREIGAIEQERGSMCDYICIFHIYDFILG